MRKFEGYRYGPFWTMGRKSLRNLLGEHDFWESAAGSRIIDGFDTTVGKKKKTSSNPVRLGRLGTGPFVDLNGVSGGAGESTSLVRGILHMLLQKKLLILKGAKEYSKKKYPKPKNYHSDVVRTVVNTLQHLTIGNSQLIHGVDAVFVAVDLSNTAHFIGNHTYVQTLLNSPADLKRLQGMLGEDVQLQPLEISNAKLIGPLMDDLISKGWLSKRATDQHKRQQGT